MIHQPDLDVSREVCATEWGSDRWDPVVLRAELLQTAMNGAFLAEMVSVMRVIAPEATSAAFSKTRMMWSVRGGPVLP